MPQILNWKWKTADKKIKLKKMITIIKNLFPAVEVALKRSKNLKVLFRLIDDFKSFNLGSLKEDMSMGWKYLRDWEKNAFVSDKEWMNHAAKAYWFLVPAKVKTFDNKDMMR